MSVLVNFNGTAYTLPTTGDMSWGSQATAFMQDVAANAVVAATPQTLTSKLLLSQPGAVGAPTYSFSADSDTGMYQPTAGKLSLATNGVDRLLIDASGNITVAGTLTAGSLIGALSGGTINNTAIGATTPSTGAFTTLSTTSTASVGSWGVTYPTLGAGHWHALNWDGTYEHVYVDGSDVGRMALYDTSGNMTTPGLGAITAAGSISAGSGFALNQSSIGGYWSADPSYGIFSFSGSWRWLWQRSNGNLFWQNSAGANLLTVANDGSITANGSVTAKAAVNAMNDIYFGFSQQSATRLQSFGNTWYWAWNSANGDLSWSGSGSQRWVLRVSDGLAYNNLAPVAGYGAYINLSDATVKTDIADADHGLAHILQLQPKTFKRKARSKGIAHTEELGFVAQDVQPILPHAVHRADFGDEPLLGMTLDPIVAALVNAVKELTARVKALEVK